MVNVKNVCISGGSILDSDMSVEHVWELFQPPDIDPFTAGFAKLSHMLTLLIFGLWFW